MACCHYVCMLRSKDKESSQLNVAVIAVAALHPAPLSCCRKSHAVMQWSVSYQGQVSSGAQLMHIQAWPFSVCFGQTWSTCNMHLYYVCLPGI